MLCSQYVQDSGDLQRFVSQQIHLVSIPNPYPPVLLYTVRSGHPIAHWNISMTSFLNSLCIFRLVPHTLLLLPLATQLTLSPSLKSLLLSHHLWQRTKILSMTPTSKYSLLTLLTSGKGSVLI